MEFRSLYNLQTAEQVPVPVELAGLANRVFAFMIDFMVMLVLTGMTMLIFAVPPFGRQMADISRTLLPLALFVIFFGYQMVQEWRLNGQSLGKLLFRIRVVRNNGQPIGFWEAFGRNLLRVIDVYFSGIGLVVMLFSPAEKRLGDYLAGTIVINDQPLKKPALISYGETGREGPAAAALMTPEEAELVQAFLNRCQELQVEARRQMAESLCAYLGERLHMTLASEADLQSLLSAYRQRA